MFLLRIYHFFFLIRQPKIIIQLRCATDCLMQKALLCVVVCCFLICSISLIHFFLSMCISIYFLWTIFPNRFWYVMHIIFTIFVESCPISKCFWKKKLRQQYVFHFAYQACYVLPPLLIFYRTHFNIGPKEIHWRCVSIQQFCKGTVLNKKGTIHLAVILDFIIT